MLDWNVDARCAAVLFLEAQIMWEEPREQLILMSIKAELSKLSFTFPFSYHISQMEQILQPPVFANSPTVNG